jgi:hypothetical protein
MPAAANLGWARQVGFATSGAATKQFDFLTCGIAKRGTHINPQGIRGSRSHISEVVSDGPYTVGGPWTMVPRPDDLDDLLPWIMGSTFTGDVITIGDTLTDRDIDIDWGNVGVPRAVDCRVNTANFQSSAGGNLTLDLAVEGLTWGSMGAVGSFPAISATLSNLQPYVHHQGTFTIGGTSRPCNSCGISIDNALILDRFNGSSSRTELPSSDLIVSLNVNLPFTSDDDDLWDLAVAGVSASIVYTNGARSITFAFANVKVPAQAIDIARNQEMSFDLPFTAYRTSATACLIVTNDLTG